MLQGWLQDGEVQGAVNINRYGGVLWYNKESFDNLLWWMSVAQAVEVMAGEITLAGAAVERPRTLSEDLGELYTLVRSIQAAEGKSDFQVEKLLEAANA